LRQISYQRIVCHLSRTLGLRADGNLPFAMGLFSFLARSNGSKAKKAKVTLKPAVSYTSYSPSPVPDGEILFFEDGYQT
jgi:hypothetical protein